MGCIPHKYRNLVAFVAHVLSLIGLIVAATTQAPFSKYNDIFYVTGSAKWEPRHWYYACTDETFPPGVPPLNEPKEPPASASFGCEDEKKDFFVVPPNDAVFIPIIWFATFYVAWSALMHAVAQFMPAYQVPLRWADYCLTAPVMLGVMALIFGSDNLCAVVLGPLLLMGLLITAWQIEPKEHHSSRPPLPETGLLAFLIVLYFLAWAPIMYAVHRIISERDSDTRAEGVRTATAPDTIIVPFASVMFVLFSSFAIVYAYDWVASPYHQRENAYITLSMISKTTLHLFIGLTVISQVTSVSAGAPSGEENEMETLQAGLIGAAVITVTFTVLNFWGFDPDPKITRYDPIKSSAADIKTHKRQNAVYNIVLH